MPFAKPFFFIALCAASLTACSAPETRQFEIRVDDEFYTVTETRTAFSLFKSRQNPARTVRVGSEDIACPVLPCSEEIRAARGDDGVDEFRRPPAGADLTTE